MLMKLGRIEGLMLENQASAWAGPIMYKITFTSLLGLQGVEHASHLTRAVIKAWPNLHVIRSDLQAS